MPEVPKETSEQSDKTIIWVFEQTEPKNQEESVQKTEPKMHGKSENTENTHLKQEPEFGQKWSIDYTNLNFHEVLGKGGFGIVHRVTFKTPYKGFTEAAAKTFTKLTNEEGEILTSLSHPNIVTVLGFSYCAPVNILVLELAPKGSLHKYLYLDSKDKTISVPQNLVRKWLKESAFALQYLHDNSILHMDIKAKNCLLFHNDTLKLCDFGLAVKLDEFSTTCKTMRGTWRYMAPENLNPKAKDIPKHSKFTDIFSYGMLVYEMCARKVPFEGMNYLEVMIRIAEHEEFIQPEIPSNCPKDLSDLMKWCWKVNPKERPKVGNIIQGKMLQIQMFLQLFFFVFFFWWGGHLCCKTCCKNKYIKKAIQNILVICIAH